MQKEDIRLLCLEKKYSFLINSILYKSNLMPSDFKVYVFKRSATLKAIWIEIISREFFPTELQILLNTEVFEFFNVGVFKGDVILEGRLKSEEDKFKEVL